MSGTLIGSNHMKLFFAAACFACLADGACAQHPQVLVTSNDQAAVKQKLEQAPWACEAYAALKLRVDRICAITPIFSP